MTAATAKPTALNSALQTVRTARRAYIGAHVMAFEFAQKRASLRLKQLKTLGDYLVVKGEDVESNAVDAYAAAKEKVTEVLPKVGGSKTVEVKPTRVVKAPKTADLSTDITPKAKTAKPASKAASAAPADKYAAFAKSVLKYDPEADAGIIKKIVDHCGIALTSRDGKYVACTDPAEREQVAKSWLVKKLGLEADTETLDAKVAAVCDIMKADRMKSRVTFYYLLAKAEGKLASL